MDTAQHMDAVRQVLTELGVTRTGEVSVADIVFNPAFRDACAMNQCGKYGTNWACPPAVGEPAELEARARRFTHGLVIQTVWPLEDEFDFDGMMAGHDKHAVLLNKVVARVVPLLPLTSVSAGTARYLAFGAGACSICETCTFASGEPCRLPGQAMSAIEAYGIDVAALITSAGLSYNNGPNTVSYVGLILF